MAITQPQDLATKEYVDASAAAVQAASQPLDADLTALAALTAPATKLAGIEDAADVTDAANVGGAVHGTSSKTTPVDADEVPLIDSAASNTLKKLTWANLKATIKAYYDVVTATLENKTFDLGSNTLTGTTAQFNTALSDGDFATLAGTETLPNKSLTSPTITGTAVLPTTAELRSFNTVDQTTNYERARAYWNSNTFTIATEVGGTGTQRGITINGSSAFMNLTAGGIAMGRGSTGATTIVSLSTTTFTASSGTQTMLSVAPTVSQSSTAGYTALLINPTESGTGSGSKKLIDAQVGSSSKFTVDNTGKLTLKNGVIWDSGTGSPEGVVTASVGSFYSRTDGGAGTSWYVKESGSGNTGWVAK